MSGIEVIKALQSISSPFWDQVFLLITELYSENLYMALLPVLFLVTDKRFARHLATIFLFNHWFGMYLKTVVDTPRPPEELWRPRWAETVDGGGFPSAHAQGPLAFWGAIALALRRSWFTALVVVMVFLIGLSRIYGGVHAPGDILGGWALGAAVLLAFYRGRAFMSAFTRNWSFGMRLLPAIAVPLLMLAIHHQGRDEWPLAGAFLGIWVGSLLEERYVGYQVRFYSAARLVVHCALAIGLMLGLRYGLKPLLGESDPATLVRYAAIGLTATLVSPWLFSRVTGPGVSRAKASSL